MLKSWERGGRNVDLKSEHPYTEAPDVLDGFCNVIKGRFVYFDKSLLDIIPVGSGHPADPFNEDIYLSLRAGNGRSVHYVSPMIRERLTELELPISGLCSKPDHYAKRDAICRWFEEEVRE
jgi:hypothetical protein